MTEHNKTSSSRSSTPSWGSHDQTGHETPDTDTGDEYVCPPSRSDHIPLLNSTESYPSSSSSFLLLTSPESNSRRRHNRPRLPGLRLQQLRLRLMAHHTLQNRHVRRDSQPALGTISPSGRTQFQSPLAHNKARLLPRQPRSLRCSLLRHIA
jgi:hypothetical protein